MCITTVLYYGRRLEFTVWICAIQMPFDINYLTEFSSQRVAAASPRYVPDRSLRLCPAPWRLKRWYTSRCGRMVGDDRPHLKKGAGIAHRTRDWKVAASNPCWSSGRIFFSRVEFLCWLLFRYPFQPCVTTVARKRSRSLCQKCRRQVTAKHACTLRMWLCMKWHSAWLYGVHRTCAETAAVSCGTSHASAVSTPLRWIFKKQNKKQTNKKRTIKLVM